MRVGILGGTFNPPHLGHLVCAQEAYVQLELDVVTLIPVRIPPHKPIADDPGAEHRLALCRLAADGDDRLMVSSIETDRPGMSFTVDTLELLHEREPHNELYLIVGADIAAGLPQWRKPEAVLDLATLGIARRRGASRASVREALKCLAGADSARFFRMPRIAISSTMIRERVGAGEPIRYLVPDAVADYIEREGLYR